LKIAIIKLVFFQEFLKIFENIVDYRLHRQFSLRHFDKNNLAASILIERGGRREDGTVGDSPLVPTLNEYTSFSTLDWQCNHVDVSQSSHRRATLLIYYLPFVKDRHDPECSITNHSKSSPQMSACTWGV
jgi:hypothetical protein